jgi:transcriptional regulator with PAS, ATPase and Fis domain
MGVESPFITDAELRRSFNELGFVTGSQELLPLLRHAYKAACVSDITVLLEGETGTGKQVLASAIHQLDRKRRAAPFVTMHCGSLSAGLAESELFGHQKGAFTGAVAQRKGLFQFAHRGTVFLDDVNDLAPDLQAKLLDVLQRSTIRAIGSDQEARVDVRVVAAANQPLRALVLQNRFRADLYHRLNVIHLRLPPLRERMQDLPDLILALARRHQAIYQPIEKVEDELISFLQSQVFPGNVRELENEVQRMLFSKSEGASLGLADWYRRWDEPIAEENPDLLREAAEKVWGAISAQGVPYTQAMQQIERQVLEAALNAGGRTRREIAQSLQTSERTLYHKIRCLRIQSSS